MRIEFQRRSLFENRLGHSDAVVLIHVKPFSERTKWKVAWKKSVWGRRWVGWRIEEG